MSNKSQKNLYKAVNMGQIIEKSNEKYVKSSEQFAERFFDLCHLVDVDCRF